MSGCTCAAAAKDAKVKSDSRPSVVTYARWFLPKISLAFDSPIKSVHDDGWSFDASLLSRAVIELPDCDFQDPSCYFFACLAGLYLCWKLWWIYYSRRLIHSLPQSQSQSQSQPSQRPHPQIQPPSNRYFNYSSSSDSSTS